MLKIEKTLKELRDLQNTLLDLGIEMSIKDADAETKSDYGDAAMTIDVYEPCRCFAWVGMDGVIHMRWNSYPDAFAWFRMNLLLDLARGYMLKADNITKSWTHLRRNLDGQDAEMPLPDKLAGRKAEYENSDGYDGFDAYTRTIEHCQDMLLNDTAEGGKNEQAG